jgi:transcription elongation factor Elf1
MGYSAIVAVSSLEVFFMSILLQRKYVNLVKPRLNVFSQKDRDTWNFRCPVCGDSKKNPVKARGYLYVRKGFVQYHCHNCNVTLKFSDFLKHVDKVLYSDYALELMEEKGHTKKGPVLNNKQKSEFKTGYQIIRDIDLPKLSELPEDHKAVKYFRSRKIPEKYLGKLYYTEDFVQFLDEFWPDHGKNFEIQEDRLIIPFRDAAQKILGFQGRSFSEFGSRYITIKPDKAATKCFGLDTVDFDRPIKVLEGPIDSMFVDNAIGTMDSSLYRAPKLINVRDEQVVDVYDNQPRNTEVMKTMAKSIRLGHKVVVWPPEIDESLKDVNDMVLAGIDVNKVIDENTFEGLRAELEFNRWNKVK